MRYLLGGAAYLVAASVALLALVTIASLYATRLVIAIGSPEVTFLTTMDQGSAREPGPAPTVPGWYYDPSGRANHQAYWDGGRWTGATRPDPLTFPAIPGAIGDGDAARKWFIILAIALTIVWLAAVVAFVGSEEPEVDRFALALLERA